MKNILRVLIVSLCFIPAAQAQETKSFEYAPEHCEFKIDFPAQPTIKPTCEDAQKKRCYDLVTFDKVFDMNASVSFKVICSKIDKDVIKTYSGEVMEKTLIAMTDQSVVKTFDTSFREGEGYKQAGLAGEGRIGMTPTIYIAQLWIGNKSAFSVEGDLTGESKESEKLFSDILKSARLKSESKPEQKTENPQ